MTIRRSAPRREVIEVVKTGEWGEVTYRHRLSCGHVESRKRPAKTEIIGCATCVQVKALEERTRDEGRFDVDDLASIEVSVAQMRASIAARCGVPQEAVDVVMADGGYRLAYVTVLFDAESAVRFTKA